MLALLSTEDSKNFTSCYLLRIANYCIVSFNCCLLKIAKKLPAAIGTWGYQIIVMLTLLSTEDSKYVTSCYLPRIANYCTVNSAVYWRQQKCYQLLFTEDSKLLHCWQLLSTEDSKKCYQLLFTEDSKLLHCWQLLSSEDSKNVTSCFLLRIANYNVHIAVCWRYHKCYQNVTKNCPN